MVVLFHITTIGRLNPWGAFRVGAAGVDLFFIISGFVISNSINAVSTGSQFVVNRVSRLYPTYWVCVTITFLTAATYALYKGLPVQWKIYVGNMTMFQYYLGIPNLDD